MSSVATTTSLGKRKHTNDDEKDGTNTVPLVSSGFNMKECTVLINSLENWYQQIKNGENDDNSSASVTRYKWFYKWIHNSVILNEDNKKRLQNIAIDLVQNDNNTTTTTTTTTTTNTSDENSDFDRQLQTMVHQTLPMGIITLVFNPNGGFNPPTFNNVLCEIFDCTTNIMATRMNNIRGFLNLYHENSENVLKRLVSIAMEGRDSFVTCVKYKQHDTDNVFDALESHSIHYAHSNGIPLYTTTYIQKCDGPIIN